jgi:3D (Asp-Asp-Asp) domain-containing protein
LGYGKGRPVEAWKTVATKDPRLPSGSRIVIELYQDKGVFLVNDTGGDLDATNHIDVFVGALNIEDVDALGRKSSRIGIVR